MPRSTRRPVSLGEALTRPDADAKEPERESVAATYNRNYRHLDFFGYKEWLYRPYIKALAKKAGLKAGCRILDAGCGQGFFTWLFADLGFAAVGADISEGGIRAE